MLFYIVMEKKYLPHDFKAYLPLIALFALLVFLMPRTSKFTYDYKKGEPWMYETLVAQFDFPILKTENQILREQERIGNQLIPYYRHDDAVQERAQRRFSQINVGEYAYAKPQLSSVLSEIYSRGVLSHSDMQKDSSLNADVVRVIYVQRDRRATKLPVAEVYSRDDAEAVLFKSVRELCGEEKADSVYSAWGLRNLIEPDLIFDQQTTDMMHRQSLDNISLTQGVFRTGQVIVSDGEIVTSEVEQLLDSYKAEFDASVGYDGNDAFLWGGNALIALSLVIILFMAIYFCNYKIFNEYNKYLFLLLVFALSAVGASVASRMEADMFYIIPFTLVALYLQAFFKRRIVFVVYFISLLPVLLFAPDGMELFIMYLVAGTIGIFVFERFNRGWLQFVTAFIVFVTMLSVWVAFRLIDGVDSFHGYSVLIDMALGALLLVAAYPLIYLFIIAINLCIAFACIAPCCHTFYFSLRMLSYEPYELLSCITACANNSYLNHKSTSSCISNHL